MNAAECRQLGESIWSPLKIILIQGSTLTLQVWGGKNVFPLLACSILDLQVETARAHTRLGLKAMFHYMPN